MKLKVLIQNLEKKKGLATKLFQLHNPDVMLVQEINLDSETQSYFPATNVSSLGYGTAIGSKRLKIEDVKKVQSPNAEFGGVIHKKTTIATVKSIQLISFHGYNGQPFKNKSKLVAHVDAVLAVLTPGKPAIFTGDFNTWTQEHVKVVQTKMEKFGFRLSYSWPYPNRDVPLDHFFCTTDLKVKSCENYSCSSDHRGAIVVIETP